MYVLTLNKPVLGCHMLFPVFDTVQSWAAFKADAEESRVHVARIATEAERSRQAEDEAQRQASLLQEALESLRSGEDPHLALHQLQLLHRLPLESVLSLQAQLCSCLHAVEQVISFMLIYLSIQPSIYGMDNIVKTQQHSAHSCHSLSQGTAPYRRGVGGSVKGVAVNAICQKR